MRSSLTIAVAVATSALLLGSCSDDAEDSAATTSLPPATSSSTTAPPTTVPSTATTVPDLSVDAATCTSPAGVTLRYPAGWDAVADCSQFGPAPVEEPAAGTDERPGTVRASVEPVPFAEVARPRDEDESRAVTTVDGLRAVRIEATVDDEGLYPQGAGIVRWAIDLAAERGSEARTIVLDAVELPDGVPFETAVQTLDLMARSLEIDRDGVASGDQVVARYEGGGAPFTVAVAASASAPATCLRLLDTEGALACVQATDGTEYVSIAALDGPTGPITVGIAGPDVWAVELSTGEDSATFLPVPYPGRDAVAFAVPLAPDQLDSVTLRSLGGAVLAEVAPAEARRPA